MNDTNRRTLYSIKDGKIVSRRAVNKRDDEYESREEAEAALSPCESQEDAEVRRVEDDTPTPELPPFDPLPTPKLEVDPDRPITNQIKEFVAAVGRRLTPEETAFWDAAYKARRDQHRDNVKTLKERQKARSERRKLKRQARRERAASR